MKIPIISIFVEYTLKASGLWPDYFNIFAFILVMSGMFIVLPFHVWEIVREFDNLFAVLDALSYVFAETLLYSKFLIIFYHRRVFQDVLKEMAEDYMNKINTKMWSEHIATAHRFSKINYGIYYLCCFTYHLQFISTYSKISVENREMLLRSYYPFDFRQTPMFEVMIFIQIVQGMVMAGLQALSETLLVSLVLHICGHIDLLLLKIDEFSENCMNSRMNVSLAPVIKQHMKILNFVNKVDTIYTYASFVQVFCSTFMICCVGLIILTLTDDPVMATKYIMLLVTATWQGYSFCLSGQRLVNKSEVISNKLYNTYWYNADRKEILAVSYMMRKSQLPLTLTAGKFTSLSMETFTSMMKTSFSYVSVLRACNT